MATSIPHFEFPVPKGYHWLIERGLVGFESFTSLQPWLFLGPNEVFDASQRWPRGALPDRLVAFAKRQDRDDLACFRVQQGQVSGVTVIHGWTSEGYAVLASHASFWDWLKSVIDEIAEWSEASG